MDSQTPDLVDYVTVYFWEMVTLVLMAIPVIAAFRRRHGSKWAILGLATILTVFEIMHQLEGTADISWPMIGWIAMFIWVFAWPGAEEARRNTSTEA